MPRPPIVLPLGALLLACGSDPAGVASAASVAASASASSTSAVASTTRPAFPPGCDYVVLPGKHIESRDPAEAPFQSTSGRDIEKRKYCLNGAPIWDAEELTKNQPGCKQAGTAVGGEHIVCPGVVIDFGGSPVSYLSSISIVPMPP